jgi:thymidylate synthase (FAD)
MRIVTEPEIYVVGRQTLNNDEVQRFLNDHETYWETDSENSSELIVELAGRVCYLSFGSKQFRKTNDAYVGNLINQGHGSVLEHAVWDLLLTGISRSLTHELVRHRAGVGVSQLSQRYVDESTADFVEPGIIAGDPELHALWQQSVEASHVAYKELVAALARKVQ